MTRLALAFAALTLICANGGQADARGAWQQRTSTGFHAEAASFHSSFHSFINKQFVAPYRFATTSMAQRQAKPPAGAPVAPPAVHPAPSGNPAPVVKPAPVVVAPSAPVVITPPAPGHVTPAPVVNPAPAPNDGVEVKGYTTKSGRVVQSYFRSKADHNSDNNWNQKGNVNPLTGKKGESHKTDKGAKPAKPAPVSPVAPAAPSADTPGQAAPTAPTAAVAPPSTIL
jgi:hypothetical protein